MSNHLAIAVTTAALGQVLSGPVSAAEPGARVTTLAPDSESLRGGDPLVNLHLLAAEPAPQSRMPSPRGGAPAPALLRLTYFISCFGDDARLVPLRLLGAVAAALHVQPLLTPAQIAAAIAQIPWLAGAGPGSAADPLRVAQVSFGAERMAALAAALGATGAASLVYEVSPVSL